MLLRFVSPVGVGAPFDADAGGAGAAALAPVFTYAPPGSTPIVERDRADLNGVNATATVVSGVVPAGNVGVLKALAFIVNSPTVATEVHFRLFVNNAPVQGLADVALFGRAGAASLEGGPDGLTVLLPERATWRVDAVDVDGALYTVEVAAEGWYMPLELAGNA